MKKKLLLGCGIPIIVLSAGIWWSLRSFAGAPAAPDRYDVVGRGDVEVKVSETGTIEALKKVEVKSKVAGRVDKLFVEEGSRVTAGQIVANIDPTEIDSQVAQFQAQLDGAHARFEQATKGAGFQVEQTINGIRQAEEALKSAEARLRVSEEQNVAQPKLSASSMAQASANLKAANENLDLLKNSAHPQSIVNAQAGFDEAKAAEENARRNLERQQKLLDKGYVSAQVVDTARAELAAMVSRLQQARKKLDLIGEQNRLELAAAESRISTEKAALETARANTMQIAITKHELAAARAAVEQAKAQLASAKSNRTQDKMKLDEINEAKASVTQLENQLNEVKVHKNDTTLVAPMTGVVTKRYIEKGELVTSGVSTFSNGTPVMQVADLSRMLIKMSVNEVDVQKIRAGLPVEITIDAARGVSFNGHISRVSPAAIGAANPTDNSQGLDRSGGNAGSVVRFAVEVTVDKADPRLKPGMSAKCAIIVSRRKNVLRLLNDGVTGTGENVKVQVVKAGISVKDKKDEFEERNVKLGLRGDSHAEIVSGLKEGDRVKPAPFTGPKRKEIQLNMKD